MLASRILMPLVKIFIRYGFSCQEFTELARWAFVQAAMNDPEFALPSRGRQFKSRAAVLTGLSRKEILRLLQYRDMPDPQSVPTYNRAARVLAGWTGDRKFMQASGKPMELPVRGDAPSFHALVKEYSGDVPPRAVLDELQRCGSVELLESGKVRLLRNQFHASAGSAEEVELAAAAAGDLLDTLENNLRPDARQRMQRQVFSNMIPEAAAARVAQQVQERSDAFARDMNQYLSGEERRDAGPRVRMGVGIYRIGG